MIPRAGRVRRLACLLDLAVDILAGVGCSQALPVGFREGENGKAFGQVLLGVGAVVGIKNDLDVGGDLAFEMLLGDVFLDVLLEVELATLPRGADLLGPVSLPAEVGISGFETPRMRKAKMFRPPCG